jgi:hypothetical protein
MSWTEEKQREVYGMTEDNIKDGVDNPIFPMTVAEILMSIMSDIQELIYMGNLESARQKLNVTKFITLNYIRKPELGI